MLKVPCDLSSSTPPNFVLKETAIPFPILTSALMQWASDSLSGHENKFPLLSVNLYDASVPTI